jgi:NSS family neurotransmitter:Na+ symporter
VESEGQDNRETTWPSRTGFILAAMGSAIGLGNAWRFPYMAYEYGGGAFLIPYLIALFISGIPLLVLEVGVGKVFRTSAPFAFMKLHKDYAWVGWAMLLLGFVVISYYTVVIAWSLRYMVSSVGLEWGSNPQGYFDSLVGVTSGPGVLGGLNGSIALWLIATWACVYLIIVKGIDRVAKVVAITVPLPVVLLFVLAFRSLTLEGADVGLEYFLSPNLTALMDPEVWLAAFAQVFFSLSLATGVMIAYSSRLDRRSDVVNNANIVALMDAGFSFFAGLVVFATLGYMAVQQGTDVSQAVAGGPGLAFVAYPTAISLLPTGAALVGVVFFIMLFSLGIDSAFATIEAVTLALKDSGYDYKRWALYVSGAGTALALLFATGGGYHWLWIVDHFFNEIGLILVGILECFIVAWLYETQAFVDAVNATSELKLSKWWVFSIKYVTPGALSVVLVAKIASTALNGFEGYPAWALLAGGFIPILLILYLSYYLSRRLRERRSA